MPSKKDLKIAKKLLKQFNIKFRFQKNTEAASCFPYEQIVFIGLKEESRIRFFSNLFHEIAHVENFRNKKYFAYHNHRSSNYKTLSTKKLKYLIRIWLRAERYTDAVGARLMKEHMPEMRFYRGYSHYTANKYLERHEFTRIRKIIKMRIDKNL